MKPMLSRTTRFTTWLSIFLNRNTGWLIAAAIVFFGLYNVGFSKENQVLIRNTRNAARDSAAAAEEAKHAAQDTQQILQGQAKAVEELKADNEQQTLILCRVIIRSDLTVELDPQEEAEIERICQDEVDRQAAANATEGLPGAPLQQPGAMPTESNHTRLADPAPTGGPPPQPDTPQPGPPPPTPEPPMPQSILPIFDEPILGCILNICI